MDLTKFISFPLRACLNCGSWSQLRTYFCESCHRQLLVQFSSDNEFLLHGMKVKTLFRWRPGESDVLSSLILRMKDESSWEVWAEEFQFIFPSESRESALLFTSESSSKKQHAQNWASALHEKFKFEVKAPLKLKEQKKKQRQLSLAERSLREFEAPVDFSIEDAKNGGKRVIFIDDVITTGQTALAAYKALGFPEKFEVWSLVYREL